MQHEAAGMGMEGYYFGGIHLFWWVLLLLIIIAMWAWINRFRKKN